MQRSILKILLICTSYNSLTQRVHDELLLLKHKVSIEFAINNIILEEAVKLFQPDLILAPFLKQYIPSSIYKHHLCLIFHPGIQGDRGASSLDWAIINKEKIWGVCILKAEKHLDTGDIYASSTFIMPKRSKASIYRNEITQAFILCLKKVLINLNDKNFIPKKLFFKDKTIKGILRPIMKQTNRTINWQKDTSDIIINKINSADSSPGLLDTLFQEEYYFYGAHKDIYLTSSKPKQILAKRNLAICLSTIDGSIWITHLKKKQKDSFKLPSTTLLKEKLQGIKENRVALLENKNLQSFKEITYEIKNQVAYLYFDFYNGAMGIEQCVRLKYAYETLIQEDIKLIVLNGGEDFFSNGIDLNLMQDSLQQAQDAWSNIHAINDIIKSIINTSEILTLASISSNAGAGGVLLALACDYVLIRQGVMINMHYKTLGLYGSEYHTYLLPKKIGEKKAQELLFSYLPLGALRAKQINLVDLVLDEDKNIYKKELLKFCENLVLKENEYYSILEQKEKQRNQDEEKKALETYRKEELVFMKESFYNKNSSFNSLRSSFVLKKAPKKTPKYLALHR